MVDFSSCVYISKKNIANDFQSHGFHGCMLYTYLDLPMMLNFCFFRNYCFFGELAFFSASERFLVLGRFGALGPPITVLTNIWNGVISRPKSVISRPKSVKINQVGRHSLAAKTQTWNGVIFGKERKISQTAKKSAVSTSSDNFAQPEVPGIYTPHIYHKKSTKFMQVNIQFFHGNPSWESIKLPLACPNNLVKRLVSMG